MFTFPKHHFDWLFIFTGFVSYSLFRIYLAKNRALWISFYHHIFVRFALRLAGRQIFIHYHFCWISAANRKFQWISNICYFLRVRIYCNKFRGIPSILPIYRLLCQFAYPRATRSHVICVSNTEYSFRSTSSYADNNIINCDFNSDNSGRRHQLSSQIFPNTVRHSIRWPLLIEWQCIFFVHRCLVLVSRKKRKHWIKMMRVV